MTTFENYFSTKKETNNEIEKLRKESIMAFRELGRISVLSEASFVTDPDENLSTQRKANARVAVLNAQIKLNAQIIAKIKAALGKKDTSKMDAVILNLQKTYQTALKKYQAVK